MSVFGLTTASSTKDVLEREIRENNFAIKFRLHEINNQLSDTDPLEASRQLDDVRQTAELSGDILRKLCSSIENVAVKPFEDVEAEYAVIHHKLKSMVESPRPIEGSRSIDISSFDTISPIKSPPPPKRRLEFGSLATIGQQQASGHDEHNKSGQERKDGLERGRSEKQESLDCDGSVHQNEASRIIEALEESVRAGSETPQRVIEADDPFASFSQDFHNSLPMNSPHRMLNRLYCEIDSLSAAEAKTRISECLSMLDNRNRSLVIDGDDEALQNALADRDQLQDENRQLRNLVRQKTVDQYQQMVLRLELAFRKYDGERLRRVRDALIYCRGYQDARLNSIQLRVPETLRRYQVMDVDFQKHTTRTRPTLLAVATAMLALIRIRKSYEETNRRRILIQRQVDQVQAFRRRMNI
jgi:hypothetical protein